jgi:hypothetical protein
VRPLLLCTSGATLSSRSSQLRKGELPSRAAARPGLQVPPPVPKDRGPWVSRAPVLWLCQRLWVKTKPALTETAERVVVDVGLRARRQAQRPAVPRPRAKAEVEASGSPGLISSEPLVVLCCWACSIAGAAVQE